MTVLRVKTERAQCERWRGALRMASGMITGPRDSAEAGDNDEQASGDDSGGEGG